MTCRGCGFLCCVIIVLIILFIIVLCTGSSSNMTAFDYRNGDKKDAEDHQPWRNLVPMPSPVAGNVLPNPFMLSGTTAERGGDEV